MPARLHLNKTLSSRNLARSLGLAITLFGSLEAHAARPFATEDAGALDKRACELEMVAEQLHTPGDPVSRVHAVQGACGAGAGTQWGVGFQQTGSNNPREQTLALGGKTMLIQGGPDQAALTLAYGGDWQKRGAGSGWQFSSLTALLVASVPVGAWGTVHANLGWTQQRPEKTTTRSWALALERPFTEQLDAGIETYGDNRDPAWWGLGLRWTPAAGLSINASAARQTGAVRSKAYSVGGKLDF